MSQASTLILRLEELLVNELGQYEYANGEPKPAIKIVPPQVTGVKMATPGVECLIYDKPKFAKSELLCESLGTPRYHVALIQHDLGKTLENSQRLISKIFNVDWVEKLQEIAPITEQFETEYQIDLETANTLIDEEKIQFDDEILISTIAQVVTGFYL